MPLSDSTDSTDEYGKERLTYGTAAFPIAFFDDDLSEVRVPWHWHQEFELAIILEGSVNVRIGNHACTLHAGEGYFANSGILHSEELLSESGHQHCMVFSPALISPARDLIFQSYLGPILDNPGIPCLFLKPAVSWQNSVLSAAEEAWEYGAADQPDYPLIVRSDLTRIFSIILHHMDPADHDRSSSAREHQDEFRIKQTLTFLHTHYQEKISIEDIARSAGISVSTCLRLYKRILLTTPMNYLNRYRLQQAAAMLAETDHTISEIAYACGFSDPGYFIRCFHQEYGMTPARYSASGK